MHTLAGGSEPALEKIYRILVKLRKSNDSSKNVN